MSDTVMMDVTNSHNNQPQTAGTTTPTKTVDSNSVAGGDNECRVLSTKSSSGTIRVGAAPTSTHQLEAQRKKRELEEKMAAIKRQLMELEPTPEPPAAPIPPPPTEQTSTEDVIMKDESEEQPPPTTFLSSPPSTPIKATDSTSSSTTTTPTTSDSLTTTTTSQPDAVVVDLTDDAQTTSQTSSTAGSTTSTTSTTTTPTAAAIKPTKKRKSKEPETAAAATSTIATSTVTVDGTVIVTDASSSTTPASTDATAATPAKKSKPNPSSSSKKPKESPEEKEARKAAEKAKKLAEAEAKKAEKERERLEAKERKEKEAEAKKLEKAKEAEEKKEAHRREIEEKKAEKQRELDAKKAEVEAKKAEKEKERAEKQKELDAKKAELKKAEEAKEAKKKSLEKSKGFMSSFFKLGTGTAAATTTTSTSASTSSASSNVTGSPKSTATQSTISMTAATGDAPSSGSKSVVLSQRALERAALQAAYFLPYQSDRKWTKEDARLSVEEREKRAIECVIDLECQGLQAANIPNLLEDHARIQRARERGQKRRARVLAAVGAAPVMTRPKLLQFHDNHRPAWFGRMRKTLQGEVPSANPSVATATPAPVVAAAATPATLARFLPTPRTRRPTRRWTVDVALVNYDYDSEDDWGEEPDDAEELATSDEDDEDSLADDEGEMRGDGLVEDGWLVPEDQDPLAGAMAEDGTSKPAVPLKGKRGKLREAAMIPIIVGPVLNLDRIARKYHKEQIKLKADPTFVPTVKLTDDMKELMMFKKRLLTAMPIDFDPKASWRIPKGTAVAPAAPTTPATVTRPTSTQTKISLSPTKNVTPPISIVVTPPPAVNTTTKIEPVTAAPAVAFSNDGVVPMEC